jgi:hypothetical protein
MPLPYRVLRLLLISFVLNTLVSGLTPFILSPHQEKRLNNTLFKLLRYAMQARIKRFRPHEDVLQLARGEVHKYWGIVDISTELTVRRLGEYRRWAADPDRHASSLAAILGTSKRDTYHQVSRLTNQGTLTPDSTPWAARLLADISVFAEVSERPDLAVAAGRDLRALFRTGPLSEDLWQLDTSSLRAHWLSRVACPDTSSQSSSSSSEKKSSPGPAGSWTP